MAWRWHALGERLHVAVPTYYDLEAQTLESAMAAFHFGARGYPPLRLVYCTAQYPALHRSALARLLAAKLERSEHVIAPPRGMPCGSWSACHVESMGPGWRQFSVEYLRPAGSSTLAHVQFTIPFRTHEQSNLRLQLSCLAVRKYSRYTRWP